MSERIRQLTALGIFGVLFCALLFGLGPSLSARLVMIGEGVWDGYAQDLRYDPEAPECDLQELEAKLSTCPVSAEPVPVEDEEDDPFAEEDDPFADDVKGIEDPFADEDPEKDPFAEEVEEDPFADAVKELKDPFADEAEADPFADEDSEKDPFAEEDPFAEGVKSVEDPFASAPKKSSVNCVALKTLAERCSMRHAAYTDVQSRLTSGVKTYRSVELTFGSMAKFPYWKHMLILLTLLGAVSVTLRNEHIALREVENQVEHRVSQTLQLVVHLLWLVSCWNDYQVQQNSAAVSDHVGIPLLWCAGFACLSVINIVHLVRKPDFSHPQRFSVARLFMTIPLFTYMGLIAGIWFLGLEGHSSGQAIYLHKFIQHPNIYLGIGLYIWAGMLFATTRVARLAFGLLTPWGLPIGVLAWLAVVLAAIPTAYSGASGIFVIAAGAVIFEQLRSAGATKRMALAATAMSGSLGVVLRPCLVVVLVAVLNKQVTTDELFAQGFWVFVLTAVLLLAAFLWRNPEPLEVNPVPRAKELFMDAVKSLLPYAGLVVAGWFAYGFLLDMWVNEQTAALILPGLLLVVVVWERWVVRPSLPDEADQRTLMPTLIDATMESSTHIGALLVLMGASVALGGVVERAEVMAFFPQDLGGPVGAMTALVGLMVLVGMTMDALGAVVLVSVTLAKVAYDNGIDPVHFWMMVLVAFELGYLTPPVALNHLLARQVIGPEANLEDEELGFWSDNEHLWLPMLVMGVALILVAYVPFLWY